MKQTEAVDIVYSLLPKMDKETPDQVITKYATQQKLSAAQVERLGHVFNTASTLATLEKDRNSSPTLLDVPKMVSSYVAETGKRKRASFLGEELQTKAAASVETPKSAEVPRIWKSVEEPQTLPKEATVNAHEIKSRFEFACEVAERALDEEAFELQKYAQAFDQISKRLMKEEAPILKLATLLADTRELVSPYEHDAVSSKLAGAFRSHGFKVEEQSLNSAPPIILARDRTGYWPEVQKGLEHLKLAIHHQAQLTEALHIANDCVRNLPVDQQLNAEYKLDKTAARILSLGETIGVFKEAADPAKKSEPDNIIDFVTEGKRDEYGQVYGVKHLIPKAIEGAGSVMSGTAEGLGDVYGRAIPSYLNQFRADSPLGMALGLTQRAEANKRRAESQGQARVTAAQDTESVANLKKLLINDEILSTKDPERVVEAYNSIRTAAPEVAADISVLRLLLRQAMETQGVDIDTATAARKFTGGMKPN